MYEIVSFRYESVIQKNFAQIFFAPPKSQIRSYGLGYAPLTLVTVATSHKLSLSCDDKMAAGSHPRSLDSKMTHKALYE